MSIDTYLKKEKQEIWFNIIAGAIILAAGIGLPWISGTAGIPNKALIGLSFIPFAIGIGSALRLAITSKNPADLKAVVTLATDERLQSIRDQSEATANRWLRWLVQLVFYGYTFSLPGEVFSSVGWWMVLGLFGVSYILPYSLLAWNSRTAKTE